jgi:hypothetical protein
VLTVPAWNDVQFAPGQRRAELVELLAERIRDGAGREGLRSQREKRRNRDGEPFDHFVEAISVGDHGRCDVRQHLLRVDAERLRAGRLGSAPLS